MGDGVSQRSLDFWQAILSLDLSDSKARTLVERVGPSCLSLQDLLESPRVLPEERKKFASQKPCSVFGVQAIAFDDCGYPENLRLVREPPVAIMVKGSLLPKDELAVAIVGTRKPTTYGRAVARKLAQEFARSGVTVVSGGAFGIDAQAHAGALDECGRTIAVLGSGVDRVYPAANRGLFERIQESGALVSQFAMGAKPDWWRFPSRNVVISGLVRAVIVVEAPEKSGSLITASVAAEEGRHVFVTPANVDALSYRGSFKLINDGATLLYTPDQVFDVLGVKREKSKQPNVQLSSGQKALLDKLSSTPQLVDSLADSLGWQAGLLLAELTHLELSGLILKTPGGYVKR